MSIRLIASIATVSLVTLAATLSNGAMAQATPKIDKTETSQAARIEQGKASGLLTKPEAARLEAGQAKVAGMEAGAKADGKVSKAERKAIKREQRKQSKRIYRQKHDAQKRAG